MARNVTVKDMDLGWKKAMKGLLVMDGAHVDVGIFPEAGQHPHGDGATVAEVGAYNEFGTDTNPERPFLRRTYEEHGARFDRDAGKVFEHVVDGKLTPNAALQALGAVQASAVKKTINQWTDPPNSPATIAAKGKNDPLVDSRIMRDSIQFKKTLGGGRAQ